MYNFLVFDSDPLCQFKLMFGFRCCVVFFPLTCSPKFSPGKTELLQV